jgi:Xaa-Pro aminopeptidase
MLIQEKVTQAKQILKELNIDCWITFVRESQLNGDPILPFLISAEVTWHSAFIINRDGSTRAFVGLYDKKTIEDTGAWDEVTGYVEGFAKPLQDYLKQRNPAQIALNYSTGSEVCDGLTHGMYLILSGLLDEIGVAQRIVSAERIISALRERKSAAEIENMRQAIRLTEEIFTAVASFIKPGMSEKRIARFMQKEVKKRGVELAWEPTACPGVFTGPDTAGAHYAPTDRKVKRGHILNMDFGVRYNGYCSDLQRTFYILEDGEKKAPADVQHGFDTIVKAIEISRQATIAGAIGCDVDSVAREVILTDGYEEFPHALGHQVGSFSHDGNALLAPGWEKYGKRPFQKLEANMVFTLEPRLTVKNRGVATVEEMVVITNDGAEFLSNPQTELILIK